MNNVLEINNEIDLAGKYICFTLGDDKYAIGLLQVKEVIGNIEATPIPQAPAYYKGIINLRGQIISIIDLRSKLKLKKAEQNLESSIVILNIDKLSLGVVVDSVDCVVTYTGSEISHSREFDTTQKSNVLGVAKKDNTMTLLLDLQTVLSDESVYHSKIAA